MGYSDADFTGSRMDGKSTSRICQFFGSGLVSWFSKKKTSMALSTAEAEYITARGYVAQILWIKQKLEDYRMRYS